MPRKLLIISGSLNPESRSAVLARNARDFLMEAGEVELDWLDLRKTALPHCDGGTAYGNPQVEALTPRFEQADGLLLAVPVYNYSVGSPTKNLLELTGSAWLNKVVGFLCAAGGPGSYMALMGFANSLMLDYRCVVIPRFVYALGSSFNAENELADDEVLGRIKRLTEDITLFVEALHPYIHPPAGT